MACAYLVTTGGGEDGSEWGVVAVFTNMTGAERYVEDHTRHRPATSRPPRLGRP